MLSEDKFMQSLSRTAKMHVDIKETEIAIVDSISPLRINVEGLILTSKNLYINEDLLPYDEVVEASTTTSHEHHHSITTIHHKGRLHVGDKVIVREMKNNKYYVACKVGRVNNE